MKKRIMAVVTLLFFLAAVLGCYGSVQVASPPEQTVGSNSMIDCAVFLDDSMSMQGFVNFPVPSEYVDAVNNVEQTLTMGWKNESTAYYRFGNSVQRIEGGDRLRFVKTDFYSGLLTQLDRIVRTTNTKKLNVIVSDFLQTDQDFQKLVTVVKTDYLSRGQGAALIGVKSRFKGYVYDVGLNNEQFYYSSGEDKKQFRPVYLLVLGEQYAVQRFCSYYEQALPDGIDSIVICWTADLGGGRLAAEPVNYKGLAGIKTYAAVDDILPPGAQIPQYELRDRTGSVYLLYDLLERPALGQTLQVECKSEVWDEAQGYFRPNMEELVVGTVAETRGGGISVRLDLQPVVLRNGGIYRLCLLIYPDSDTYRQLQTVKLDGWKMEDSFEINSSGVFEIDTTLELKKFVRNLSNVAYNTLHPHYRAAYVYCRY